MSDVPSSYYPPRARWYSGVTHLGANLRRRVHLDAIKENTGLFLYQMVLSVLPGYGPFALGRRTLAKILLSVYVLSGLTFLASLGHVSSSFFFGLMLSAHAISIVFTFGKTMQDLTLARRIGFTLGALFIVCAMGYYPAMRICSRHLIVPVRIGSRVVVINSMARRQPPAKGAWLAYRFEALSSPGFYMREGIGLDPVLGVAGDQILFFQDHYEIGGKSFNRLPSMPAQGSIEVPEKHCFVWPNLVNLAANRTIPAEVLGRFLSQTSLVPEERWVGRPFSRWFFRRQQLQ